MPSHYIESVSSIFRMYHQEHTVYHGPHSDIIRARDSQNNAVALKVVDLDFCLKPHDIKHEIALVQKLHHTNVLPYLDLYELEDDCVLVTPLYQYDLSQLIRDYSKKKTKFSLDSAPVTVYQNQLPEDLAYSIVKGVCQALEYIHANKIIHRDIKPGNIYFSSVESAPVVGDFGIAYEYGVSDEPEQEKYLDICSGSYKPPELCFGVTDYSYEVDMWSMGVVLTALYSTQGEPAFELGDSDIVLLHLMFQTLGSPSLEASHPLFWPTMDTDKYHFKAFTFEKYPPQPVTSLIPRCTSPAVQQLAASLLTYEAPNRALAAKCTAILSELD